MWEALHGRTGVWVALLFHVHDLYHITTAWVRQRYTELVELNFGA